METILYLFSAHNLREMWKKLSSAILFTFTSRESSTFEFSNSDRLAVQFQPADSDSLEKRFESWPVANMFERELSIEENKGSNADERFYSRFYIINRDKYVKTLIIDSSKHR